MWGRDDVTGPSRGSVAATLSSSAVVVLELLTGALPRAAKEDPTREVRQVAEHLVRSVL